LYFDSLPRNPQIEFGTTTHNQVNEVHYVLVQNSTELIKNTAIIVLSLVIVALLIVIVLLLRERGNKAQDV